VRRRAAIVVGVESADDADPRATPRQAGDETLGDPSLEGQRVLAGVMSRLFGGEREPVRLGRFVLLRRLGEGGMGEVFACYDAELDRKVAVKVLHRRLGGEHAASTARLRAEAKAIAKLAHPNVVPIFEVGDDGGDVYLVMELVEGTTLRGWIAAAPRSETEILDAFVQIGRGLAAAHAAGVVHRDLKPDNVLVGTDGRVRLVDFGLARSDAPGPRDAGDDLGRSTIAGTPRYMAPEQFEGRHVDARADQFAFCVSLFEALHGKLPFRGASFAEIGANVLSGTIDATAMRRPIAGAIDRVMRRGLATDPSARFDGMDALLDALARARGARRRHALLGVAALSVVGIVALVWHDVARRRACEAASDVAAARWRQVQPDVDAALRATDVPWSATAARGVDEGVRAWVDAWGTVRGHVCAGGDASDEASLRTIACLDEGLATLDAVAAQLVVADAEIAASAPELVASLEPPAACEEPTRLATIELGSPEQRGELAALVAGLARVRAGNLVGAYAEARDDATRLLDDARGLGQTTIEAELLLRLGKLDDQLSELDAAQTHLEEAYFLAGRRGLSRIAALAAIGLAVTIGVHGSRPAAGQQWLAHAAMMAARSDDPEVQISLHHAKGGVLSEQGAFDEAVVELREALRLVRQAHGERHPGAINELIAIGSAESAAGHADAAQAAFDEASELVVALLGDEHPLLATVLHNAGNDAVRRGELDAALAAHRSALAIRERAYGGDHVDVAASLSGIGAVLGTRGDAAGAHEHFVRAVAIVERRLGPDHPRLANDLGNAGLALLMLGRPGEARVHLDRACALLERGPGVDDRAHAVCLENLADALDVTGDAEGAIAAYRRALAIRESIAGPRSPTLALTTANLAMALRHAGRPGEALDQLARIEGMIQPGEPAWLPVQLELARSQLADGRAAESRTTCMSALASATGAEPNPTRADVKRALADAHAALGDAAAARTVMLDAIAELETLGATEAAAELRASLASR
jgi:tetratricopeptide (TPR) repeat protein